MRYFKFISILGLALLISNAGFAKSKDGFTSERDQSKFIDFIHTGMLGVNIGGAMPIPIPNYVHPTSFTPKFCPVVGYEMTMMSQYGVGLTIGLRYETKGMQADADVYQIYTNVETSDMSASGYFTGNNHTEVYNQYLVLPIGLAWQPKSGKWMVNLNFYLAQAVGRSFKGYVSDGYLREGDPTGNRIEITEPEHFDFKDQVSTFDYGLEVGFYRTIYKRFQFNAHLSWGLTPITDKDFEGLSFKMNNVFGRIGLSYRLF